jgi:hypothetical protein
MGWLNIYSSSFIYRRYVPETVSFILLTIPLIFIIQLLMVNFMKNMQNIILLFHLLSLAGLFFGKTIAGQRCCMPEAIQPSEFGCSQSLAVLK